MKLMGKFFIKGKIKLVTGMTIGTGGQQDIIGGIDNEVIKNSEGIPYIPGSSFKGKLRSLIEIKEGKNICDCGVCDVCKMFGTSAHMKSKETGPTRLYVRDANLDGNTQEMMNNRTGIYKELELSYTETKMENTIDRLTSEASNPRTTERVPAGARFDFELSYNILEKDDIERLNELFLGLNLLEDDYLGSSGSRGYGKVKLTNLEIGIKSISDYMGDNNINLLFEGDLEGLEYDKIKSKIEDYVGNDR